MFHLHFGNSFSSINGILSLSLSVLSLSKCRPFYSSVFRFLASRCRWLSLCIGNSCIVICCRKCNTENMIAFLLEYSCSFAVCMLFPKCIAPINTIELPPALSQTVEIRWICIEYKFQQGQHERTKAIHFICKMKNRRQSSAMPKHRQTHRDHSIKLYTNIVWR